MNESPLDDSQLTRLRKMAKGISLNFWLGVFGVAMSFFENSAPWTWFVVLTAWIGIVMGLLGGPGYADYLLKRLPEERRVSVPISFILSIVTFWVPTIATALFGLALTGALREGLQPQSRIDDEGLKLIIQSFSMYFLSAGMSWAIVNAEVKKVQQARAAVSSSESDESAA